MSQGAAVKGSILLGFRPPRIAIVLLAVSLVFWHMSPPGTFLHVPDKFIGTVLVALGFVLMFWAWVLFKRAGTAVCLTALAARLILRGPYKLTRNPMYLGMLMMLMGAGFFMGTAPGFIAPCAFYLVIDKVFIPHEESLMREAFGSEYAEYSVRVSRWL